jgi:hypothetical protein
MGGFVLKQFEYRLDPSLLAPQVRFWTRMWEASSTTPDSTDTVLNRSAGVTSVNRRCRWYSADLHDFRLATFSTESTATRGTAIF